MKKYPEWLKQEVIDLYNYGKSSCAKIANYLYAESSIHLERKYNAAMKIVSAWS